MKLWWDIRQALRYWRRSPVLTLVAALALALGIGANCAIFSTVNAVLLRPLPFAAPEQLVVLTAKASPATGISWPDYQDFKSRSTVFAKTGASVYTLLNMTGQGLPEHLTGVAITSDLLPVLGVSPMLGRNFLPGEDVPGQRAVLLSHGLWQRLYTGDRNVLGRSLRLNGYLYTIVGVMPPGFEVQRREQVWVSFGSWLNPRPDPSLGTNDMWDRANKLGLIFYGRLKEPLEQAQAQLVTINQDLRSRYVSSDEDREIQVLPLRDFKVGNNQAMLWLLFGAVLCVLLITCANVANLQLARAVTRSRELAIRAAVGASRSQLVRQLLTESLLLCGLGGALGLGLTFVLVPVVAAGLPNQLSGRETVTVDASVLFFSLIVTALTGILTGLAPALRLRRLDLLTDLKDGQNQSAGTDRLRLGQALIVGQITLALILLSAAMGMLQGVQQLQTIKPGFTIPGVLSAYIVLPEERYTLAGQERFVRQLVQQLNTLPGIESVAAINSLPLGRQRSEGDFQVGDKTFKIAPQAHYLNVTPDYFRTLDIPVVAGRAFTEADGPGKQAVAIINDRLASTIWPDQDPIGKRIHLSGMPTGQWLTVVGVVGSVYQFDVNDDHSLQIYRPFAQDPWAYFNVVIRSSSDPLSYVDQIKRTVAALDPQQPVYRARTLQQVFDDNLIAPRLAMTLLVAFALIALLNSAVGVYGVMSYLVARRTREIGIRIALGATSRYIYQLILGHTAGLTGIGIVCGAALAYLLNQLMQSYIYGLQSVDWVLLTEAALLLAIVILLASYLPARRAVSIEPLAAIRHE